jgi:hypothetical protein
MLSACDGFTLVIGDVEAIFDDESVTVTAWLDPVVFDYELLVAVV